MSNPKMTQSKIPSSRLARLGKFGGLTAKIVGNMLVDGTKELTQGKKVSRSRLLLTPDNVEHVANQLGHLRGAAMKLGQMLSMDAGELLSPELSHILARLRSDATPMLHKQLKEILDENWGEDWLNRFSHFDLRPFAAASIGQVHLAHLENGKKLAVKIQYPGVRQSIASDIDNVAVLLKLSGLLPKHLEMDKLLEQAKYQLQNEADYQLEADYIAKYQTHINTNEFSLPQVVSELSNKNILVMDFVEGIKIEEAVSYPAEQRNKIVANLIALFLQELFDFRLMQTDPNFANFLYQPHTETIGLLDFGATRAIPETISKGYRSLMNAAVQKDKQAMQVAAKQIGFFGSAIDQSYLDDVLDIFELACEPLRVNQEYDFASSNLATRVKTKGLAIKQQKHQWHTPPVDAVFIHRKIAGIYLLAVKLKAKVNVHSLFQAYVL
ncbi:AarF/ABC1/UbiB kinase family protein [Shewanella sp. WXL01]|uniref:ABC1 kinase family protein n=1 Tax=Shewanella sp. WXL01 TaxID=2709721 RepID=UPI0014384705|nr:AarF/ABC1/UbiB kinase family protein [Shewanella sp. WXL01]NKF52730.1 AarF/ABC1/UbiB kinase family protein [Shewanella sp. WXL01]